MITNDFFKQTSSAVTHSNVSTHVCAAYLTLLAILNEHATSVLIPRASLGFFQSLKTNSENVPIYSGT